MNPKNGFAGGSWDSMGNFYPYKSQQDMSACLSQAAQQGFDSIGSHNQVSKCSTCGLEIFPPNSLRGYGNNKPYCACVKVQKPIKTYAESRREELKATSARWFEHPDPLTKHERETQFQAYKARLVLELGLEG